MGGTGKKILFRNWVMCCFVLCFASLSLGITSPVFAQEDPDEFMLEEITVTAEKREAEIQKIPMDISVVKTDAMDRMGVTTMGELDKMLPDLNIENNAGSFINVSIRNVRNQMWNPTLETTTAIHMDGVQLTRVNGFDNMLFDLQRLEVLKGPQGTLYGRGSTSGSMNMISQKPILDEFSGSVMVEFGNFNLQQYRAAINIPIYEKLAVRFAGRKIDRDGYTDTGYSDADSYGARVSVTWEPTDKDTVIASYDMEGFVDNGFGNTGYYFNTYGDVSIVANPNEGAIVPPNYTDGPLKLPFKQKWAVGDLLDTNWNDNESSGYMAQWEHLFDFGYLTAVYGHRELEEDKQFMWQSVSLDPVGFSNVTEVYIAVGADQWLFVDSLTEGDTDSLEMRLTSNAAIGNGDKYQWIVGAVYQDDMVHETAGPFYVYDTQIDTTAKALFGEASYDLHEGLIFSVGYRYAMDKKEFWGATGSDEPFGKEYKWNESTYKFNLSWQATKSIMSFVQYSKGYKTGNIDNQGREVPPEFLDSYEVGLKSRWLDNKLQVNLNAYYYDYEDYNSWSSASKCLAYTYPDTDDAYNSHVCADTNGNFYIDQEDYVYNETVGIAAGGSEQIGLSGNIMWLLTYKDMINASFTWQRNEYKDYFPGGAILALYPDADNPYTSSSMYSQDGEEFGGVPTRGNIMYSHTEYIGMDTMIVNASAFYQGDGIDVKLNRGAEELGIPGDDEYIMPGVEAYWTFDASVTYNSTRFLPKDMRWSARFWCNNVFDNQYLQNRNFSNTAGFYGKVFPANSGTISGGFITPRRFGFSVSVDF